MTNKAKALKLDQQQQAGITLIEVLVSMVLLAVFGLAITMTTVRAFQYTKYTEVSHAASTMAISKLEEISSLDTADLNVGLNGTEAGLTWASLNNFTFNRTTTLVINGDNSRTVTVNVISLDAPMNANVTFDTTIAASE